MPIYALYQTVSVVLLFVLVQQKHQNSLFRYRSEVTETNQNKLKQTETILHFQKKYQNLLYQTVSVALPFVSVQSKHRNFLFRYRTKTNILFRIVPKLVSVPDLVVSNRNQFSNDTLVPTLVRLQSDSSAAIILIPTLLQV